jgi:hypothetical protein
MFGYVFTGAAALYLLLRCIVYPFILYLFDAKGFRKYPNLSPFSGFSNIPYMVLSTSGRRSEKLAELHQKHPVIRIGPNSLSFGDCKAIKVGGWKSA